MRLIPTVAFAAIGWAGAGAASLPAQEPTSLAPAENTFQPYVETILGAGADFDMVPISGGSFVFGSPDGEDGRSSDEGPQVEVSVGPFWMAAHEVTWALYDAFRSSGKADSAREIAVDDTEGDVDAVTRPTNRYGDESFGFGKGRQPVLGISYHAAREFTRWLSAATGKAYRLPTEVEWEYACRAGSTTAYSFGDDPAALDDYGWHADNSDFRAWPVGKKQPNAWGIHDLHGNVAEFCLDQYEPDAYAGIESGAQLPVVLPDERRYPHVVRGGSWDDDPPVLRCAARTPSSPKWSKRDPQQPKGIWWHTDAPYIGLRVVRALEEDDRLKGLRSKITRESP